MEMEERADRLLAMLPNEQKTGVWMSAAARTIAEAGLQKRFMHFVREATAKQIHVSDLSSATLPAMPEE